MTQALLLMLAVLTLTIGAVLAGLPMLFRLRRRHHDAIRRIERRRSEVARPLRHGRRFNREGDDA